MIRVARPRRLTELAAGSTAQLSGNHRNAPFWNRRFPKADVISGLPRCVRAGDSSGWLVAVVGAGLAIAAVGWLLLWGQRRWDFAAVAAAPPRVRHAEHYFLHEPVSMDVTNVVVFDAPSTTSRITPLTTMTGGASLRLSGYPNFF